MSIQAVYAGALEAGDTVSLSGPSKTVVLPGEATIIILAGVSLINGSGSAVTVSLYRDDGSTDHVFWRASIAANSTVIIDNLPQPLVSESQSIKAQASTGGGAIDISPIILRQQAFGT